MFGPEKLGQDPFDLEHGLLLTKKKMERGKLAVLCAA